MRKTHFPRLPNTKPDKVIGSVKPTQKTKPPETGMTGKRRVSSQQETHIFCLQKPRILVESELVVEFFLARFFVNALNA